MSRFNYKDTWKTLTNAVLVSFCRGLRTNFCFLACFQKTILFKRSGISEERKYMAQFFRGKTVVCSFIVET